MDSNIQKYFAFLYSADLHSFTKAAEKMNYSQAAVSRMIKDLEEDWHICLFERNHSKVNLTSDALEILPGIRRLCDEYQKLGAHIDELNGMETGLIRIGSFASVATYWLPNIIRHFKADYPNVDYEVSVDAYTNIEQCIWDGTLDFAFLPLPTQLPLDSWFLESDYFLVAMPKGHPLCRYDAVPPEALNDYPFLLIRSINTSEVEDYLQRHHVNPLICLTSMEDHVAMAMVEQGLGVSILSSTILTRCPFQLELRPLSPPMERRIGFVLKDRKTASIAVKRFMEYLDYRHDTSQ